MRYRVDDLQAVEPGAFAEVEGITVELESGFDARGFRTVSVTGPSREAVLDYVRSEWGDEDEEWFRERVADRIATVGGWTLVGAPEVRRVLLVSFDVTGLPEWEVDALAGEAMVQGEHTDGYTEDEPGSGHRDVEATSMVVDALPDRRAV